MEVTREKDFNPRAPCGARRCFHCPWFLVCLYFNPRAPCGARQAPCRWLPSAFRISIHAPLAGRDAGALADRAVHRDFNPRAPCGARRSARGPQCPPCCNFNPRAPCGARRWSLSSRSSADRFQSTRPLRGATSADALLTCARRYFNPRAPCGARQQTCTKNMYMFVRTDKRNSFPCRTLSVRAPDEKL